MPQAGVAMASAQVDAFPSISASKLGAGANAAAIQAAEPRSTAPLRILVTRRTENDRIIGVQKLLSDMGYLEAQDFDGTLGKATATAIKAFQKANGMAETGTFNEDLVKKVYEIAGKGEPPVGHLFVRQEFGRLFDGPVTFKDPETPLGTHIFTALKFAPGDTKAQWITISLQGDDFDGRTRPHRNSGGLASEDLRTTHAGLIADHRRHGHQHGVFDQGLGFPRLGQGHAGQDHVGQHRSRRRTGYAAAQEEADHRAP